MSVNDQHGANHAKGSVKEAIGKITGDRRAVIDGAAEKAEARAKVNPAPMQKPKDAA